MYRSHFVIFDPSEIDNAENGRMAVFGHVTKKLYFLGL